MQAMSRGSHTMTQPEIAKLPIQEKPQLMESPWDSFCRDPSGDPVMPVGHKPILEERLARLDEGEEPLIPWEEAKNQIRAQIETP